MAQDKPRVAFLLDRPLDRFMVKMYAERHSQQFSVKFIGEPEEAVRMAREDGYQGFDAMVLHKDLGVHGPQSLHETAWLLGLGLFEYVTVQAREQNPELVVGIMSGEFPDGTSTVIGAGVDFYMSRSLGEDGDGALGDLFLTQRLLEEPNKALRGKAVNCLPDFHNVRYTVEHFMSSQAEADLLFQALASAGTFRDTSGRGPFENFIFGLASEAQRSRINMQSPNLTAAPLIERYQIVQAEWINRLNPGIEGNGFPQRRK